MVRNTIRYPVKNSIRSRLDQNLPYLKVTQPPVTAGGFNVPLYLGDGSSNNPITGVNFRPDLVWFKNRDTVSNNYLLDSVRGDDYLIYSNLTVAQDFNASYLNSFDSDGFTVGSGALNIASDNYVAWCWKADQIGYTQNDAGDPQTEKYSTDSGLSIIRATGNGISGKELKHSQGGVVDFVLSKTLGSVHSWAAWHKDLQAGYSLFLDFDNAETLRSTVISTSITDVTISSDVIINGNNEDTIYYLFSEVAGKSKFGSYTGGSVGTKVTTGIDNKCVIIKRIDTAGHWNIIDAYRVNGALDGVLRADTADAEFLTSDVLTFESDGFTLNNTGADTNAPGGQYIYAAFA